MATLQAAMDGLSACECPICFQVLSESRAPMSMPCGHTLCRDCVDLLVSKATNVSSRHGNKPSPTFQCPLCREWVNQHSVTLNVTLRDLIVEISRVGVATHHHGTTALYANYSDISFGVCLDRGAFGEVYRASWKGNDVAVKIFSSGQLTPEAMQAFQREVFVMNCLRHPNVVLLMGACQTPPKLAIVMEYVAGGSLHKLLYIDKVSLDVEPISHLGIDICRGLQYLHSINILHRDLKSKNVLLTGIPPAGSAKLCDFGLARMRLESATMTGNIGTVHWSAPEVLLNQRYQFSADIYGFGMVLYEMTCGQVPFHSMLPIAVVMAVGIHKKQPNIPSTIHPQLSELIISCISWEAAGRPSVSSVLSLLSALLPTPNVVLQKQKSIEEKRALLVHSNSLGVVFVSATDTTDMLEGSQDLAAAAKLFGLTSPEKENNIQFNRLEEVDPPRNQADFQLATNLYVQDMKAQLKSDYELAEQLQMKENAYRTPGNYLDEVKQPPKKVLESIKSHSKMKKVSTETMKQDVDVLPIATNKTKTSLTKQTQLKTKKMKSSKKTVSTSFPLPPPPPSPPPLPPPPTTHPHSKQKRRNWRSPKQQLLQEVRTSAPRVSKKLRPVETIEKRAFRVGHVVDGYSSEASQFTFQNQITTFNKKLLHHVSIDEPQPAFPIGRVLSAPNGLKVKRLSSLIETRETNEIERKRTTPTRRLQPVIRNAIEVYPFNQLHHVNTAVKQSLPSADDILREKDEASLQQSSVFHQTKIPPPRPPPPIITHSHNNPPSSANSGKGLMSSLQTMFQGVMSAVPGLRGKLRPEDTGEKTTFRKPVNARRSLTTPTRKLHPVIREDIECFKVNQLNLVETVVKQSLPTADDIIGEKKEQALEVLSTNTGDLSEENKSIHLSTIDMDSMATRRLHPLIRDDIESFEVDQLDHIDMVVKQSLPTADDILREKTEQQDHTPNDSEQQISDESDLADGFW